MILPLGSGWSLCLDGVAWINAPFAQCKAMVGSKRLVKGSGGIILGWRCCFDGRGAQPLILSNKRALISFSYRIYQLMLLA